MQARASAKTARRPERSSCTPPALHAHIDCNAQPRRRIAANPAHNAKGRKKASLSKIGSAARRDEQSNYSTTCHTHQQSCSLAVQAHARAKAARRPEQSRCSPPAIHAHIDCNAQARRRIAPTTAHCEKQQQQRQQQQQQHSAPASTTTWPSQRKNSAHVRRLPRRRTYAAPRKLRTPT